MIEPNLHADGFSAASDEAIMGAITARDENALAALYERHGDTLRSIIESVIHEQAEAEETNHDDCEDDAESYHSLAQRRRDDPEYLASPPAGVLWLGHGWPACNARAASSPRTRRLAK